MAIFIYNLLFPLVFIFFLPGLLIKLWRRPGWKRSFGERFAIFSPEKRRKLESFRGAVWIHAVSVGETQIALDLIAAWLHRNPELKIVLSTTTTTGQQLAQDKSPPQVAVIFCPIDFIFFVCRVFMLIRPSKLVVLETEIWPNMLNLAAKYCESLFLINARMSDKSVRGYCRARIFVRPMLKLFTRICVQSEHDRERFATVCPEAELLVTGNMKFDRAVPANVPDIDFSEYFGEGRWRVILASCTHPGEERLIASALNVLKLDFPDARLVIVPRHAERASEVSAELRQLGIRHCRRTTGLEGQGTVDCLLADTTGEMFSFIKAAEIVIMGKSMAGHNEGHNLIEPALFAKPVITGGVLTNFRFVLDALKENDALLCINSDTELVPAIRKLLSDPGLRDRLGRSAGETISRNRGALEQTINILEK